MAAGTDRRVFEFGGFRADTAQRRLLDREGIEVELPSRAFDVLVFMLEHPGELLDKNAILQAVWPRTVVEEGSLTQCIFTLRRALGDTAGEQRFIATVPGRGYQFVGEVCAGGTPAANAAPPVSVSRMAVAICIGTLIVGACGLAAWRWIARADSAVPATSAQHGTLTSIAVLPFDDLSPRKDMEYFADGIAEEITGALSTVPGLQVSGRRSAFSFKGRSTDVRAIGERLKVASVLAGTIRKEGERLRISAQLSRTPDGFTLWTETYDRNLDDAMFVQGIIAREVAMALDPMLRPTAAAALFPILTEDRDAYSAYLRGRYLFARGTGTDIVRASEEFESAVKADPQFALAHAWLARCYTYMKYHTAGETTRLGVQASASMDRALTLDPAIEDVWWIEWIQRTEGRLFATSAARLERAVKANPNDADAMFALSWTYRMMGRRDHSLALLKRAYLTDPLSPTIITEYAQASYFGGAQGDRARFLSLAGEIERVTPESPLASNLRAMLALHEGDALEWDRQVERQVELAPLELPVQGYLSIEYANLGATDAALHHAKLCQRINPKNAAGWYNVAHIRFFSGDLEAGRAAVQETLRLHPADFLSLRARAELAYFSGDCMASVDALVRAQPELGETPDAIDTIAADPSLPILTWCLRRQGNLQRAQQVTQAFERQHPGPMRAGYLEGLRARMSAANGDRAGLLGHLRALAESRSMEFAFSRHEPMIQAFLDDREIEPLLAALEARRAEWRRILPKSSMRVPIPDAPPNAGS